VKRKKIKEVGNTKHERIIGDNQANQRRRYELITQFSQGEPLFQSNKRRTKLGVVKGGKNGIDAFTDGTAESSGLIGEH